MGSAVIGALRVTLGLDTAAFQKGLSQSQKELARFGKRLEKVGDAVAGAGRSLSVGLTAPLALAGGAVIKFAGDFEASMNKVAISTEASAGEMKAMNDLALQLGKDTVFSASEAADAMDMLAKNGLDAQTILGGAAKAAIELAAATGSELDPAAAAITDTMQQFHKTAANLPAIVNQITGAVNASKLDFNDFQKAMGAAGGVAGGLGVNFEDFTAALAGTSAMFASGEDAGTSFKTFLTTLVPKSKEAAAAIQHYGLSFFDAQGNMRSMSAIAQQLQEKLGGLSEQARNDVLSTIFGTDAMRTAIGLMQLGGQGLDSIREKIAATDAAAQSAQRLKGFNGQLEQLKGSLETLAIAIGQSGILEIVTGIVMAFANFVDTLSALDPWVLKAAVTVGVLVAAVGPLLIAVGSIVNAVGAVIPIFIALAPAIGAIIPILASLGSALVGLAVAGGPLTLIALAVGAVYLAWKNWDKIWPILQNLYQGVKTWLVDKMRAHIEWVIGKIRAVGDAFYELYDRVVGHSYVPDMVDGIGDEFGRLPGIMVDPALDATGAVSGAFEGMASGINRTLSSSLTTFRSFKETALSLLDEVLRGIEQALTSMVGGSSGSGGLGGAIATILGGVLGGGGSASPTIDMAGIAAMIGPTTLEPFSLGEGLPGFKTAGSFEVGGSGGPDSQLMQFYASPGEMVNITKGEQSAQAPVIIKQTLNVAGGVDLATRTEVARLAAATRQSTIQAMQDLQRRRP